MRWSRAPGKLIDDESSRRVHQAASLTRQLRSGHVPMISSLHNMLLLASSLNELDVIEPERVIS
jgi:hypothetical protein